MPATLRAILVASLLAPLSAWAQSGYSGAWVAWICPSGVERSSGQCSNFVLELMEKDGKLCGSHMFATAGAARIDEGGAPSLTADIDGGGGSSGGASGIAVSTLSPTPIRMRIELTLDNGALRWKRLDSPSGDYLLPLNARLTKSRSRTLLAPVFEQELRAACAYVFNTAADQAASNIPGSQGQGAPAAGAPAASAASATPGASSPPRLPSVPPLR